MGKINLLDVTVANLIAAGEVVERPASAIKELIENSFDAGAKNITVEIKNGGISFFRVTDDGSGIAPEDVPLAIKRHATSKISKADDLSAIMTLGFRGEALAAIAAVSNMRIITKTRDNLSAVILSSEYGQNIEISETGAPLGTTVIVEELFSNTPARLKFLKKDSLEAAAVSAVCEKAALSHPDVAIKFISDNALKFSTDGDGNLYNAIYSLFGSQIAKSMEKIDAVYENVKVSGYVLSPSAARGNRNFQNFFINGRYIKSRTLSAALEQAYDSFIPKDKFPGCVLDIRINPSSVDVNVHPTKLEVKFSNEKVMFESIYGAVRRHLERSTAQKAFEESAMTKDMKNPFEKPKNIYSQKEIYESNFAFVPKKDYERIEKNVEKPPIFSEKAYGENTERNVSEKTSEKRSGFEKFSAYDILSVLTEKADFSGKVSANADIPFSENALREDEEIPKYRIIGEIFECYIIIEKDEKVYIIDKHALHERINFEEFKKNIARSEPAVQEIIGGLFISFSAEEIAAAKEYEKEISSAGFYFKISDGNRAELRAAPMNISTEDAKDIFSAIITSLMTDGKDPARVRDDIFERALYQGACKASIKGGRQYDISHIRYICDKFFKNENIRYCPHGRPVFFEFSKREIENKFRRT